jgi:methyl-accepting chemotaxis protein
MRDLPIGKRLGRILAALAATLMVMAIAATGALLVLRAAKNEIVELRLPATRHLGELDAATADARIALRREVTATSAAIAQEARTAREAALAEIQTIATNVLEHLDQPDERQLLQTFDDQWNRYEDLARRATALPPGSPDALALLDGEGRALYAAADETVEKLIDHAAESAAESSALADRVFWTGLAALLLLTVFAVGVVLFSLRMIRRMITAPLLALHGQMERLAKGDTSFAIEGTERGDEIGMMARAVQVFRQNAQRLQGLSDELERALGGVVRGLKSAGGDLSQANGAMSEVAERAATEAGSVASGAVQSSQGLQQIAASIAEFSASIGEVSRQAAHSRELAEAAARSFQETRAVGEELERTAVAIGEVVGLITDIAEQTNLLALNATIEAARAGEAGRGFAVVAAEVKSLASQTAKATQDISAKVDAIRSAVTRSVESTGKAAESLDAVTGAAAAIASAVQEQSAATEEVSRSVNDVSSGVNDVTRSVDALRETNEQTRRAAATIREATGAVAAQCASLEEGFTTFLQKVRSAA